MLKVAIEISYTDEYQGNDEFGTRLFMQELFIKQGIELVRVSVNKLNKKNEFAEYVVMTKNGDKTIKKTYKPDIVWSRRGLGNYYKYSILRKDYLIVPSKKISIVSNDKYETYLFCKEYQPKTVLLSNFLRESITTDGMTNKVVIKPIRANGGKGIKLMNTKELHKMKDEFSGLDELYIVQEFKNFSQGYPGIVKGNHDIRLMFAGEKIIETTLRIPEKGNFKSNLGAGGTQSILNKKILPKELIDLSKKIYKTLKLKGNDIFSMDFAYCKDEKKRYLIEINSSPGTRYYQTNEAESRKIGTGLALFFKTLK